jgi:hypothetical protein
LGSPLSSLPVRVICPSLSDPEAIGEARAQTLRAPIVPLDENLQLVRVVDRSARLDAEPRKDTFDPIALMWNPLALLIGARPHARRCYMSPQKPLPNSR